MSFHSFGVKREKSLGRVDRCPGCFSEGFASLPVLAELSEWGRGIPVGSQLGKFDGMKANLVGLEKQN